VEAQPSFSADSRRTAIKDADRKLFEQFKDKAEAGEVHAQYNLGVLYHRGTGVQQSHILAVYWYGMAAARGLAVAQNNLGFMYEAGTGVGQDLVEAARWYREAADQGYAKAQLNLCELYRDGRGVAKDLASAYTWCDRAAESGDPVAIEARDRIATELAAASGESTEASNEQATDPNVMLAGDKTRFVDSPPTNGVPGKDHNE
jgi:hypothetical protein